MAQLVKNLPAMWETSGQSLGWEDPREKGKTTQSSILAWRSPWNIVRGVAKRQTQLNDFHMWVLILKKFKWEKTKQAKVASPLLVNILTKVN